MEVVNLASKKITPEVVSKHYDDLVLLHSYTDTLNYLIKEMSSSADPISLSAMIEVLRDRIAVSGAKFQDAFGVDPTDHMF